ncbi:hypothetical protein ABI59_23245 [Acidobacteria bacterium Mor1]|nr:hypothetical protein ABI59_23245 [Acidobacteria bacterium Mor1]
MKDDYSGAHLLIAFLAGAAAGAAVALLSSPKTGSENRDSIAGWAKGAQGKAGKVPGAIRNASRDAAKAATEAFTKTLKDETAQAPSEEEVEVG